MKILVTTRFDCTRTGTTGNYSVHKLPMTDAVGEKLHDELTWKRSRNKQRNYETLCQIVGMRTQLLEISAPWRDNDLFCFEVIPDRAEVFHDQLRGLKADCQGVPMITGLDEQPETSNILQTDGADANIWFQINT